MGNISFFDSFKRNKVNDKIKNNISNVNQKEERVVKLSREQIYNSLFEYIASFKKMHGENLEFNISSSEWRLFFEVFYVHFLQNGIINNYQEAMEFVLQYVLSFPSVYQEEGLTLKSLVSNIGIPLMLCRVPDDVSKGIRRELDDTLAQLEEIKRNRIPGK